MKHHELVRWGLTHEVTHYTMLTMRRFTTMSYCLPNWRLIYTSLLLVSILFAGCRSDADIETQPASKLSTDQLVTQTFHYTGSDETIQTIMESIKQLPEAKGMAAHLSQVKARLVWQGISHVGEVGVNEIVYIPIHIQGEDEINWIWVIYLDHGTQISSEFLNRAEVYDDHLWLFDYLTQKGLGHVAKSGVYYTPPSGARSFRKEINGKLYECTRAHSFTVGNLYDDDMNVVDGGSSTRFHPENCVPVFSFQGFDRPGGRFSGAPVGFWGRFSGADSGNPGIAPERYTCIRYESRPPIINEPTTTVGPIQPPPCGDYRMKIQEPQMNSHIKSLFDYVRSEDSRKTRKERGFVQLRDGTFKDITGEKRDEIAEPNDDFVGMMHTHVSNQGKRYYFNQSFSLRDIRNFISRVFKAVRKEIPKDWDTNPSEIDLSKYYTGVVSKHGVYILTFNKKIKNYSEFISIFGQINKDAAKDDNTSTRLMSDQSDWISEQISEVDIDNININDMQDELLTREEQYVLNYLHAQYPSLKEILGLMFFDLTKDQPEGYSIYNKKRSNEELFYNRHDCK